MLKEGKHLKYQWCRQYNFLNLNCILLYVIQLDFLHKVDLQQGPLGICRVLNFIAFAGPLSSLHMCTQRPAGQ